MLITTPEHAQPAVAHDTERAVGLGFKLGAIEAIIACAQESEMISQEPLQELNRFRDLIDRLVTGEPAATATE